MIGRDREGAREKEAGRKREKDTEREGDRLLTVSDKAMHNPYLSFCIIIRLYLSLSSLGVQALCWNPIVFVPIIIIIRGPSK